MCSLFPVSVVIVVVVVVLDLVTPVTYPIDINARLLVPACQSINPPISGLYKRSRSIRGV